MCVIKKFGKVNFTRSNPNKLTRNKHIISFRKEIKEGKLFWSLVVHISFLFLPYATDFDVHNIGAYICHLHLVGTMLKQGKTGANQNSSNFMSCMCCVKEIRILKEITNNDFN